MTKYVLILAVFAMGYMSSSARAQVVRTSASACELAYVTNGAMSATYPVFTGHYGGSLWSYATAAQLSAVGESTQHAFCPIRYNVGASSVNSTIYVNDHHISASATCRLRSVSMTTGSVILGAAVSTAAGYDAYKPLGLGSISTTGTTAIQAWCTLPASNMVSGDYTQVMGFDHW